jgi:dihydrofolate synthase/folylpolyglutamate synthase
MERLPQGARIDPASVIHVTGSNGKGTVTMLTAALLSALGLRVGTLISPHVTRFEERTTFEGTPISARALADGYAWFEAEESLYFANNAEETFGAFEAITAIALHAFADAALDALVLEAGIGGRYDATRAAQGKLVALTSVEREHASVLGPSLEHILYDKADLAPPGGLLIAGRIAPSLRERLTAYGRLRGIDVLYTDEMAEAVKVRLAPGETYATIRIGEIVIEDLRLPTTGTVQLWNAIHALLLARALITRSERDASPQRFVAAARAAFAATALPLRFEKIATDPDIFIDGAHTEAAAQALADSCRETLHPRPLILVLGLSSGKPAALIDPLLPLAASVIATRAHHRAAPSEAIAAHMREQHKAPPVIVIEDLAGALARAKAEAIAAGGTVLVTGAFYLAAEARALLRGEDATRLRFL